MRHESPHHRRPERLPTPDDSLSKIVREHRIVVCVGSGGVGKTTTAAAIALRAALEGRRALCLTIDPAKRLANSLGLTAMQSEEQTIPASLFAEHGLEPRGSLSAMMLDPKKTFDELVTRHASSPAARRAILRNRIYQFVSSSLAGTQEYMAMEKLHTVRESDRWDLIVLDTPPTTNALDFLDAPERLVEMIDSPAMRWFLDASGDSGSLSLAALSKGAALLLKALAFFTGAAFLDEVGGFVAGMNDLFGGFRERAALVSKTLRGPDVAFVLVTSPAPMAIREALFFDHRLHDAGLLRDAGMLREAVIVNHVHPLLPLPTGSFEEQVALATRVLPEDVDPAATVTRLARALDEDRRVAEADREHVERLRGQLADQRLLVEVPAFEEDVHDLGALARLGTFLFTGAPSASTGA